MSPLSDERDLDLLADILDHAQEAVDALEGVTYPEYLGDRILQLASERLLEIIGEAAGGLSAETREAIDYDWRAVRGVRNILAHQYGHVDPERVYAIAKDRLPELARKIRAWMV